ncbi:hypothetical protein NHQ30_009258 [Ciborinia camelliae]|nr:hypothetical protein NHQ30_009258 [Ciborinia camelliae]
MAKPSPPMAAEYLGPEYSNWGSKTLPVNEGLIENFPDNARYYLCRQLEIEMIKFTNLHPEGIPLNKCANNLANHRMTFAWRGSMIVVQRNQEYRAIGDVQPSDLRITSHWFRDRKPIEMLDFHMKYSFDRVIPLLIAHETIYLAAQSNTSKVSAVVIHCEGGTQVLKKPEDENWGGLSPRELEAKFWLREIGTILVARKDRKSIIIRQVEAIANYFRRVMYVKMGDLIHQYEDGNPPVAEKERVTKELLNREAFDEYFETLKKTKIEAGEIGWSTAISPFDA